MADDTSLPPNIDLNRANLEMLTTLPGIGPRLAKRIIQFREEVHPFEEAIEITAVPGISERMYRQWANRLTVEPVATGEEEPATGQPEAEPDLSPAEDSPASEADPAMPAGPDQPESAVPVEAEESDDYYILQPDESEEVETPVQPASPPQKTDPPAEEEGYILSAEPEKNGGNGWQPWLLAAGGALLGAFLALLLIFSLNSGTLVFENHPKVVELETETRLLREREVELTQQIKALQQQVAEFDALSARLQNSEAEIEILKQARDTLAEQVATLEEESAKIDERLAQLETLTTGLDEQVTLLEESSQQMQSDIDDLQQDTGRFDDFLTQLRDLLLAVQGTPDALPGREGDEEQQRPDRGDLAEMPVPEVGRQQREERDGQQDPHEGDHGPERQLLAEAAAGGEGGPREQEEGDGDPADLPEDVRDHGRLLGRPGARGSGHVRPRPA